MHFYLAYNMDQKRWKKMRKQLILKENILPEIWMSIIINDFYSFYYSYGI